MSAVDGPLGKFLGLHPSRRRRWPEQDSACNRPVKGGRDRRQDDRRKDVKGEGLVAETLQQLPGLLEVGRIKAFGEPAIDVP
jgi:hypothetical protein